MEIRMGEIHKMEDASGRETTDLGPVELAIESSRGGQVQVRVTAHEAVESSSMSQTEVLLVYTYEVCVSCGGGQVSAKRPTLILRFAWTSGNSWEIDNRGVALLSNQRSEPGPPGPAPNSGLLRAAFSAFSVPLPTSGAWQ